MCNKLLCRTPCGLGSTGFFSSTVACKIEIITTMNVIIIEIAVVIMVIIVVIIVVIIRIIVVINIIVLVIITTVGRTVNARRFIGAQC